MDEFIFPDTVQRYPRPSRDTKTSKAQADSLRRHHGKRKSFIGSSERESAPCPQSSPHEKRLINVSWNCRKTFIVEPEIHFVRDTEVLSPHRQE